MNIAQTRQIMAYLWATHPSAPRYSDDDKVRTVAAYFRVLYRFDMHDVLDAVDKACRKSPAFVPSAYEIEALCHETYGEARFLPPEHGETVRRLETARQKSLEMEPAYNAAWTRKCRILGEYDRFVFLTDEQRAERDKAIEPFQSVIQAYGDLCDTVHSLEDQVKQMETDASIAAREAYTRTQSQLAAQDLRSLGYERLALEG